MGTYLALSAWPDDHLLPEGGAGLEYISAQLFQLMSNGVNEQRLSKRLLRVEVEVDEDNHKVPLSLTELCVPALLLVP